MRLSPLSSLAAIALTAGLLSQAHAGLVPGKKGNCSAVWDTGPAAATVSTTGKPSSLTCNDGDPSCDADGIPNGVCIINLNVCVGQATAGCTPSTLRSLTFNAPTSKKNPRTGFHAPPVSPPGCGLAGTMSLSLKRVPKNTSKPLKKFKPSAPVTLVMKAPGGFVNKLRVQCVSGSTTGTCPNGTPGQPNQVTLTVPPTGSDLDNGWTGTSHNFPIINGSQLRYCLDGCDGTTTFQCTGTGATGPRPLNGAAFGAPLPLLPLGPPVGVATRCLPGRPRD